MELPTCPTCQRPLRAVEAEQLLGERPDPCGFMVPTCSGIWEWFCGGCFGDISKEVFEAVAQQIMRHRPKTLQAGPADPDPVSRLTLLSPVEGEDLESFQKRQARAWKRGPITLQF